VIKDAPLTIAAAFVVIGLGVWRVVSWADSTIISGKDATIETQKAEIDSYKDKLSGASPDQAKARIDDLEARLSKIEPRHLSVQQSDAISKNIAEQPGTYTIYIATEIGCNRLSILCTSACRSISKG
jgi:hypothetical protein